jgi:His/Glu/Gln/Arg/opine family amino acid ABC transporter permease subunit
MKKLLRQFKSTFIEDSMYKLFMRGILNTLVITFFGIIIGFFIGTVVALIITMDITNKKYKIFKKICKFYILITRGTPLVVQLLITYYIILSNFNNSLFIAILCLGVNSGAYMTEIIRSGILSIEIGQIEAGKSLGLSTIMISKKIIMPQALKNILPAFGNEIIALLKETSIVGYITVMDITRAGNLVRAKTNQPFFSLIFTAIVYLLIVVIITKLLKILEKKITINS